MKLSTRGRYGVRLMFDLADHYGKGPILLKDIAARQGISEKYLWQLISPLKNIGLIHSTRGARGGYELARPPAQINLKEIVSVLEGPIHLVGCVGDPSLCERDDSCVVKEIWHEVSIKLQGILASYTLEDLLERQKIKTDLITYII